MKKILLSLVCFSASIFSLPAQILYGISLNGGTDAGGSIIKFDPVTNNLLTARSFKINDSTNGSAPAGGLMLASDGKLYGMTNEGGSSNKGVIYSFDPSTSGYAKLFDFDGANGANPYGTLVQASDGKMYGLTYGGGNNSYGVIFSFDPSNSTYLKLKDFDFSDGAESLAGLVQAADGRLYGMTELGGSNNTGVIFSYDPASFTYTKLSDFNAETGHYPASNFLKAKDGKLYAVAPQGGAKDSGLIFSFNPLTSVYTKLKDFDYPNGGEPLGAPIQAGDGKFYGMTFSGGANGLGVIYSFDPSTSAYSKLFDFDAINGVKPYGSLVQASNGKLYGMTSAGGPNGYGIIFSFDPSSSVFTKLTDYDAVTHTRFNFYGEQFVEVKCDATSYYQDADGDGYGNANVTIQACTQPNGYVTDNTDCDDTKASVHPGATEICGNGVDDNCDGQVDENCNGAPYITINDVTADESQGQAVLTVTLSHPTSKPVWVLYFTKDGTAMSWGRHRDYKAELGLLVIRPGALSGTISIKIIKDNIAEPTEYFDVVLLTALNGNLANHSGRVFIPDEAPLTSSMSKYNRGIVPPSKGLSIIVLSNPSPNQFNVTVESSDKVGKIDMKIVNAQGKVLETRSNIISGQTLRIGNNYRPGSYFLQAVQGSERKATTLIKLSE